MSGDIGKRIRGLRRLKGLTQQQLAGRLDISVSLLSNIERGVKKPPPAMLENLAYALGVSGEELFFFPEKRDQTASMS